MKLIELKKLGDGEIFFKAIVEMSVGRWWEIWRFGTVRVEYVGNQLGWYNATSGERVTKWRLNEVLTGAVRMNYIKDLMVEEAKASLTVVED